MRLAVLSAALVCFAGCAAAQATFPYDHIHILTTDPAASSKWFETNFGGKRITEAPDRLMYGAVRLMFIKQANAAKPSAGSVIDHIGFSVPDIDAKMKQLEASGVKITSPVRAIPNLAKVAFVEDPNGVRIEVIEDKDLIGLHHIHLRTPDPDAMFSWLQAKLGGEKTKFKGQMDAMVYDVAGFSKVWILVQKGDAVPSEGHAIDHIGWRSEGPLKTTIDNFRGEGVQILTEPRPLPLPNGPTINFSYIQGPAGAKIEIVERPGLKPGQ
jgi:lactoylglutathione lyase